MGSISPPIGQSVDSLQKSRSRRLMTRNLLPFLQRSRNHTGGDAYPRSRR
ncbi:MAG: hypothetical protein IPG64_16700 [Haliea sp.]|nr:hypothetical protein [Haliea sp.]